MGDETLLITASPQLAADWKRRFLLEQPRDVVATPQVNCWHKWLPKLASEHGDIPIPLTALQEHQLWERIIDADMGGGSALTCGLARHAAASYRLLREYHIDMRELTGAGEEAEALARWITAMQQELKDRERVLAADIPQLLLPTIGVLVSSPSILLDGFGRFTPLQQSLLQALQKHGAEVAVIVPDSDSDRKTVKETATITLSACADAEAEYRLLARRIASTIDTHTHHRIAVVTSRQVNDTEILRRILNETLLSKTHAASSVQAVNMAGKPLATMPLIRQLLSLLHLAGRSGSTYADLSSLLFSPGVKGYVGERFERAALDAKLREDNRHYLSFKSLLDMKKVKAMPQLANVLRNLIEWKTDRRMAGEWVKAVHALLQTIGFLQVEAGERTIAEIRQLNAFRECLASLATVDAVSEKMDWGSFVSLLISSCNETLASDPVHCPQVSVLPLEQIAGLRFDTVFAVGFDEEALPLPGQPAPLLPFSLQRQHHLPGSTAQLAFSESDFYWQQMLQAAPVVHASFAKNRDERLLGPSSFLAGIDAETASEISRIPDIVETEPFDDATAVPLLADERVRGGASIIKNQSVCPFRAFASHRLIIAPLGETEPGIKPTDKGSLLHRALQYIWETLSSQEALLALDDTAVADVLNEAVEHAWREFRILTAESTQQFERQRMVAVLTAWLDEERNRPPFSVERCEKPYHLKLPESGNLQFPVTLKADRIDRDGEGRKILIDYKTGQKQSIGKWIGERPSEPQLPLYAVAEALGKEDAVCFARVRSGDMGFEGLSGEATGIRGIAEYKGKDEEAEDWPALLSRWRERIDALAAEFVAGRCDVSPQDAHACDYCGLEAICRIDEIGIDRDENGENTA